MKLILAAALLVPLAGCGSIYNLATGPRVFGGVQQDLRPIGTSCLHFRMLRDIPFSAIVDTGLLPLTALFEIVRWMSGWPSPGVK